MNKGAFTGLALFGVGINALCVPLASSATIAYFKAPDTAWTSSPGLEINGEAFVIAFMVGFVGAIFALVGGLVARPRFVWILFIVVGLLYCFSLSGIYYDTYKQLSYPLVWPSTSHKNYLDDTVLLLPGIALIVGGLVICKPTKKPNANNS